jgi:hypothetical protein
LTKCHFIVGVLNFEKSQGNCYIVGNGYFVLDNLSLYFLRNGEDLSCDEHEYYNVGEIDDDDRPMSFNKLRSMHSQSSSTNKVTTGKVTMLVNK